MTRFYFILYLIFFSPSLGQAQPPGFSAINNFSDFKLKFAEEGKKIQSIQSLFVQEKNLTLLEEKIVSEGKFWFERERKVRIEYQKPFRYLMIMNGDQIVIRDDQKESKISAHSNKLFQQINRIVVDCVNGKILENKDFTSRIFQNEKTYLFEMTPASKTIKEFFQKISVLVDKTNWSVLSIKMEEPGGDNTLIRFFDKEINKKLDEALFVH